MPSLVNSFSDEEFSVLFIIIEMAEVSRLNIQHLQKATGKNETEVKLMLRRIQAKLEEGMVLESSE